MHRSMREQERAHKTTEVISEGRVREKEMHQGAVASQLHAHERATVPDGDADDGNAMHTAVKHSVGRYIEKDGAHTRKTLRRERY